MRTGCLQIVLSPQKNLAGGTKLRIVSKALPMLSHGGPHGILDPPQATVLTVEIGGPRPRRWQAHVSET